MRCDGYPDCHDHSDEINCDSEVKCAAGQRHCLNKKQCVLQEWICDRETDCKDTSDEQVTVGLGESVRADFPKMYNICPKTPPFLSVCRTVQSLQCSVEHFSGCVPLGLGVFLRAGAATAPQTAGTRATRLDVSQNNLQAVLDFLSKCIVSEFYSCMNIFQASSKNLNSSLQDLECVFFFFLSIFVSSNSAKSNLISS